MKLPAGRIEAFLRRPDPETRAILFFGPDAGLTGPCGVVGTLRYMPPEQTLVPHGLVDHRADVYGLGATLYCLLTDRPPLLPNDRGTILDRAARGEFPRPSAVLPDIDPDLERICLRAMARDPGARFASPRAMSESPLNRDCSTCPFGDCAIRSPTRSLAYSATPAALNVLTNSRRCIRHLRSKANTKNTNSTKTRGSLGGYRAALTEQRGFCNQLSLFLHDLRVLRVLRVPSAVTPPARSRSW